MIGDPLSKSVCYTTSLKDLVDIWVETMHEKDHVVIVWDAIKYYSYLKEAGFQLSKEKLFDNKILTILTTDLDSALELLSLVSWKDGPFVQVYSLGKYITDNIETQS